MFSAKMKVNSNFKIIPLVGKRNLNEFGSVVFVLAEPQRSILVRHLKESLNK